MREREIKEDSAASDENERNSLSTRERTKETTASSNNIPLSEAKPSQTN